MKFTDPARAAGPPQKDDAPLAGEAHVNIDSGTDSTRRTLLEFALFYAQRGWPVFPLQTPVRTGTPGAVCSCRKGASCAQIGKHPRYDQKTLKNGHLDATLDETLVRQWWRTWPDANIGIATGKGSGIIVIDTDPRNGGNTAYAEMIATNQPFPVTPQVLTGGGGTHDYFRYPYDVMYMKCSKALLGAGLDVKADGGYVVAPPSLHPSGHRYTWELSNDPADIAVADIPPWLFSMLRRSVTEVQMDSPNSFCASASLSLCTSVTADIPADVMDMINQTLPPRPGTRRDHVLKFVRGLKIDLGYTRMPLPQLRPWVRAWHDQAWLRTSRTKTFDDTWFAFATFWPDACIPLNGDLADTAYQQALTMLVPECAKGYENPRVRLLVSMCKALKNMLGTIPFLLSSHQAGRLLGIGNSLASKWMHGLCADGVLECVSRGTPGPGGRKDSAAKWRYLGD